MGTFFGGKWELVAEQDANHRGRRRGGQYENTPFPVSPAGTANVRCTTENEETQALSRGGDLGERALA